MFEEALSIPSIWASMNSWFTPTVLFVLLNVMIGTIAVTSGLGTQILQKQQQTNDGKQPQIDGSPSVIQRLKSINFYSYRSQEPNPSMSTRSTFEKTRESDTHYASEQTHEPKQTLEPLETETQQTLETLESETQQTIDEIYDQLHKPDVIRTKSGTIPASGELPAKIKKSASMKSAFEHFEGIDVVESRRPATVREGKAKVMEGQHSGSGDDDGVDAKADDFINKFKQQLKLQRVDSFKRYKDMINRGSKK